MTVDSENCSADCAWLMFGACGGQVSAASFFPSCLHGPCHARNWAGSLTSISLPASLPLCLSGLCLLQQCPCSRSLGTGRCKERIIGPYMPRHVHSQKGFSWGLYWPWSCTVTSNMCSHSPKHWQPQCLRPSTLRGEKDTKPKGFVIEEICV